MDRFFFKSSNTKFHENPWSGSRVVPCGPTDMTKLIVACRNFANERADNSLSGRYALLHQGTYSIIFEFHQYQNVPYIYIYIHIFFKLPLLACQTTLVCAICLCVRRTYVCFYLLIYLCRLFHLAQHGDRRWRLLKSVMQLLAPYRMATLLSGYENFW